MLGDLALIVVQFLAPILVTAIGYVVVKTHQDIRRGNSDLLSLRNEILAEMAHQSERYGARADKIEHDIERLARNAEARVLELEMRCKYVHGSTPDRRRSPNLRAPSWAETSDINASGG